MLMPASEFLYWPRFFDPPTIEVLKAFTTGTDKQSAPNEMEMGIAAGIQRLFEADDSTVDDGG